MNAYRAVLRAKQRAWTRSPQWQSLTLADTAATLIPDGTGTPLVRTVTVTGQGTVQDVAVTVAIDHEHLGDVSVALRPPSGQTITIQGRTLANATHLEQRYDLSTTPALRWLLGQAATGGWQLRVQDHAPGHSGRLVMWELQVAIG